MIKPEQIPTEAWTAATIRLEALRYVCTGHNIREAIAEAINAWPRSFHWKFNGPLSGNSYILPMTQEKNDDWS